MDNLNTKHILSENFQNLTELALKEKQNYKSAKPFPNIALNNFFNNAFLNKVLDEFPDLSKLNDSENYNVKNEIKFSNKNYKKFSPTIKSFVDFLIFLIKILSWLIDLIFLLKSINPQGFSLTNNFFSSKDSLNDLMLIMIAFFFILILINPKNFLAHHF